MIQQQVCSFFGRTVIETDRKTGGMTIWPTYNDPSTMVLVSAQVCPIGVVQRMIWWSLQDGFMTGTNEAALTDHKNPNALLILRALPPSACFCFSFLSLSGTLPLPLPKETWPAQHLLRRGINIFRSFEAWSSWETGATVDMFSLTSLFDNFASVFCVFCMRELLGALFGELS